MPVRVIRAGASPGKDAHPEHTDMRPLPGEVGSPTAPVSPGYLPLAPLATEATRALKTASGARQREQTDAPHAWEA